MKRITGLPTIKQGAKSSQTHNISNSQPKQTHNMASSKSLFAVLSILLISNVVIQQVAAGKLRRMAALAILLKTAQGLRGGGGGMGGFGGGIGGLRNPLAALGLGGGLGGGLGLRGMGGGGLQGAGGNGGLIPMPELDEQVNNGGAGEGDDEGLSQYGV